MYSSSPQISPVQHSFLPVCVGFSSKLRPRPSVMSSPLPLLLPSPLFSSTNRMESTTPHSLLSPNSQQTVDSLVDGTSISAHTNAVAHLRDRDFLNFVEDAEPFSGYYVGGYHLVHLGERYGDGARNKMLHKLGNGTFSTVWLAKDLAAKKYVKSGDTS